MQGENERLETLKGLYIDVYNTCWFEVQLYTVRCAATIMWLAPFHSESKVLCGEHINVEIIVVHLNESCNVCGKHCGAILSGPNKRICTACDCVSLSTQHW